MIVLASFALIASAAAPAAPAVANPATCATAERDFEADVAAKLLSAKEVLRLRHAAAFRRKAGEEALPGFPFCLSKRYVLGTLGADRKFVAYLERKRMSVGDYAIGMLALAVAEQPNGIASTLVDHAPATRANRELLRKMGKRAR